MGTRNHHLVLTESQQHIINPTNPRGALHDRVEHWLHVCRRAANDTENFGRCGLMFQCLAQLGIALLKLLEQPYVFDGDYGLVGESFEKRDLLVSEGSYFGPVNDNYTDGDFLAH